MRLMSIVTASVVLGATTGLSSMRASAQNYAAGSSTPTGMFTWTYESGSNRKSSLAYPNGATASWAYNNRGELISVQNRHADGTAISTYDYTYDAAGRRISKNDERYGYNARSELTQATSISDSNFHAAYQFDDIGNRETSAEFGIRSGEYTYTANELNQYASIVDENSSDSAAPSDATFTPAYDADGNQTLVKTKTGIWQVTYNAENRPVKWTCGTTNLVMAFDRMGRRVLSEVQVEGTPVKTETYVYDGYTCILRKTTIHTNAVPTTIRDTFVWDPTEPVATRPLVWNRVEEKGSIQQVHPTAFYFQDGNKNVSDVVSSTDETKAHYTYAPFGDSSAAGTLAQANPWRFSSEYADDEIGCVYYNYRHYEPMMGRWLLRDPNIKLFFQGLSYLYCLNNPLSLYDQLGLWSSQLGFNVHQKISGQAFEELLREREIPCLDAWNTPSDRYIKVLEILNRGNASMDQSPYNSDDYLYCHYNRKRVSDDSLMFDEIQKTIYKYWKAIRRWKESIKENIDNSNCVEALRLLGQLLHMLQDYYGHGVSYDYHVGDPDSLIGNSMGDPDSLLMKPSDYAGLFRESEHGKIYDSEPGTRAPDGPKEFDWRDWDYTSGRLGQAKEYTKKIMLKYLRLWCEKCCDDDLVERKAK